MFYESDEDVLDISNFFPVGKEAQYWSGMISFILASIENLDIVGHERNHIANNLHSFGFESIGNLTVFIKYKRPPGI
jgi:hypothetical protein